MKGTLCMCHALSIKMEEGSFNQLPISKRIQRDFFRMKPYGLLEPIERDSLHASCFEY